MLELNVEEGLQKRVTPSAPTVTGSSAEAELYGIVKATAELKGLMILWMDLGVVLSGHLLADASAALGILKRRGLGKVRHLNTNYLWV